jgi:hypothetical protein
VSVARPNAAQDAVRGAERAREKGVGSGWNQTGVTGRVGKGRQIAYAWKAEREVQRQCSTGDVPVYLYKLRERFHETEEMQTDEREAARRKAKGINQLKPNSDGDREASLIHHLPIVLRDDDPRARESGATRR